jgi:hypothetical protein
MITLHFLIRNPFSQKFVNLWNRTFNTPFEHKFIELEFYKDSSLLSFRFDLTARQSHSGLNIEFGLIGYCVNFTFYDCRHWNYAAGKYEYYEE